MNTKDFIEKSISVHGDKYDYSKTKCGKCTEKVEILCKIHGSFWQRQYGHLEGKGCPKCANLNRKSKQSLSTQDFIAKAKKLHKNKYDYSKTEYYGNKKKIIITCPEHGKFEQTAGAHLCGQGCPICGRIRSNDSKRYNKDIFVEKARKIHSNKYDYSKVIYKKSHEKVIIICPEHGEFRQAPSSHLQGVGCGYCNGGNKLNNELFIEKAQKIHKDKYDYSMVSYKNNTSSIIIICPEHGKFKQTPQCHLVGQGCPKCGRIRSINSRRDNTKSFIRKARKIHGNKYDYSKVKYENTSKPVIIICQEHGEFKQMPQCHLGGHGCNKCGINNMIDSLSLTTKEFVSKSKLIHGNVYDYSKVDYKNTKTKVTIICPKHGEFKQQPNSHLNNSGCPLCPAITSNGHKELLEYIKDIYNGTIIENNKETIKPYELDIYLPDINCGIEFDGLYWHSAGDVEQDRKKKYKQYKKKEKCVENNIKLLQIREDEWLTKKEIVKSTIKHKIQKSSNRIYARKCSVEYLNNENYKLFTNNNHIQGHRNASIKIGLIYNSIIIMVISFNKHLKHQWEITRMASLQNCSVIGGASKLLNKFILDHNPTQIMTYADRRYSDGLTYKKLGFELVNITNPNYIYVKNKNVFSRQHFQKNKLHNKLEYFDQSKSERENMFANGYRRFWDSGHMKFIWNK